MFERPPFTLWLYTVCWDWYIRGKEWTKVDEGNGWLCWLVAAVTTAIKHGYSSPKASTEYCLPLSNRVYLLAVCRWRLERGEEGKFRGRVDQTARRPIMLSLEFSANRVSRRHCGQLARPPVGQLAVVQRRSNRVLCSSDQFVYRKGEIV